MKTRFNIDVVSGTIIRTADGVVVPTKYASNLTAGDVLDAEVTFSSNGSDVTAALLAGGMLLKLGLRKQPGDGGILAQSQPHSLASGVASCLFSLNTQEIADLFADIGEYYSSTVVAFEVEISKPDGTFRQTISRQAFTLYAEVNGVDDVPPATAAVSATNAAASAAAAAASANAALNSANTASAAATAAGNSATDAGSSKTAAQAAQTAAEAARTAAQTAQTAAELAATAAAASAVAANNSATDANAAKVAAQAAQTAATASQLAAAASKDAALGSELAAAAYALACSNSATAAAASALNAAVSASASAVSAAAAATSQIAAAQALANQFLGGVAGNAVPATAAIPGNYYRITTAGTSQGKTWAVGDLAVYNGTSGSWTQIVGILPYATTAQALADVDTTSAMNAARVAERLNLGIQNRANRDMLYLSAASGARAYWPMGSPGNVANAAVTIGGRVLISSTPGCNACAIGSNNALSPGAGFFFAFAYSPTFVTWMTRIYFDASNFRDRRWVGLQAAFAGQIVHWALVWDRTGAPSLYINGILWTVFNDSPVGAGTIPAWTDAINSSFLGIGTATGTTSDLPALCEPPVVINAILQPAEILAWAQTGRLPMWCDLGTGSMVNLVPNSDFALDPTVAANGRWALGTNVTWDNVGNKVDFAVAVATAMTCNGFATDAWSFSSLRGRAWRITFTVKNYVSGQIRLCTPSNTSLIQLNGSVVPYVSANGTYTYDVLSGVGSAFALITQAAASLSIDDVTAIVLGPIIKPVVQAGRVLIDAGANKITGVLTADVTALTSADVAKFAQAGLSANGEFVDTGGTLPVDAIIEDVVVKNPTGNKVFGFAIGSASGVDDLTYRKDIAAGAVETLEVKRTDLLGLIAGSTGFGRCYYSATGWNSGVLNISIRYRRERDI